MMLGVIGWIIVVVAAVGGEGFRSWFGPARWADFINFYTLGHVAANHGPLSTLTSFEELYRTQVAVVPDSKGLYYPPVYPLATSILFAPFAALPFWWAGFVWGVVTLALYGLIVKAFRPAHVDAFLVWAAAFSFPPLQQLVAHGQCTIVALVAFAGGTWLWRKRQLLAAGLLLGLLALKPQLGILTVLMLLLTRQWRVLAGFFISVAMQVGLTALWYGPGAIAAHLTIARTAVTLGDDLSKNFAMTHSLRTVTRLLPGQLDTIVWAAASVVVIGLVWRVWRSEPRLERRMAVLLIGTVLTSPHLFVYDAVILVLAGLWLADDGELPASFWTWAYVLTLALFFPSASLINLQISVLVLVWMLYLVRPTPRRA
jgi:hypothetical protein